MWDGNYWLAQAMKYSHKPFVSCKAKKKILLGGRKNFRVGIFFDLKLVRVGLQETNNFFLGLT